MISFFQKAYQKKPANNTKQKDNHDPILQLSCCVSFKILFGWLNQLQERIAFSSIQHFRYLTTQYHYKIYVLSFLIKIKSLYN